MKITIVGTGYVGLVTGACLADMGNQVLCLDIDAAKVKALNAGRIPIYEPGLEDVVKRNRAAGRLSFSTDVAAGVAHGILQLIAVGTPPGEDGSADLQHVLEAARAVGRHMDDYRVVVNKSTVPVGTADKVCEVISNALKERNKQVPFSVVSNPEFLKEGAAVEDFMRPDRIIVGSDDARATAVLRELYAPFQRNHERLMLMSVRSAELAKYAANAMLATRISFMNELANLAEAIGADIEEVRRGIGSDSAHRHAFPVPGRGLRRFVLSEGREGAHAHRRVRRAAAARGRGGGAGERGAEARPRRQDQGALRRGSEGPALRDLGPCLQAQYRRHARSREPDADRGPAGGRGARFAPTIRWRNPASRAWCLRSPRWMPLQGCDALAIVTEWARVPLARFRVAEAVAQDTGDFRRPEPVRSRHGARARLRIFPDRAKDLKTIQIPGRRASWWSGT